MIEKQKEVSGKYHLDMTWISYIPLMILVGIVPLIVRMVNVDIADESILYITGSNVDLFSQAKGTIIFVMIGLIGMIIFFVCNKQFFKNDTQSKIYYVCIAIYAVMTIVSMFMSEYEHVAKWGMPDRAEGGVMLLAYLVMALFAFWIIKGEKSIKFVLIPLGIMTIIMSILGYYQYIGQDIFLNTEWGKNLIIPEYYASEQISFAGLHEKGKIYGTLFHYNYVGSFTAMIIPLFITILMFIKDYRIKIGATLVAGCGVFLLFGSTSRAGLIGVACSVIIFLIIFIRYFLKHWKILLAVMILGVISIIGLDKATGGEIFARIPSLVRDVVLFFEKGEPVDYTERLPIKGLSEVDGEILVELAEDEIRVVRVEEGLEFYNAQGEKIVYIYMQLSEDDVRYFTQDTRYEDFRFKIEEKNSRIYARLFHKEEYIVDIDMTQEFLYFVSKYDKMPIDFDNVEYIGFEGKERLGSARGYIWSRSLPVLKDHLLVGSGPDTFAFEFPQNDLFGKWYAYNTPNMTVDKPHNLYLQIGINQGGIALLAFITLMIAYLVQGMKLYGFKKEYTNMQIVGAGIMLAMVGYLGAGIFNDSIVSVAPIFWILLGTGMAVNYLVSKTNKEEKKKSNELN